MSKIEVDKAFELVLVIAGLVASIMTTFPELFWVSTEQYSTDVQAVQATVIPMIIIVTIWVSGKLVENENRQVFIKLLAWTVTLSYTLGLVFYQIMVINYSFTNNFFGTYQDLISLSLTYVIAPVSVFTGIFPKYKKMYPDASFLRNNIGYLLVAALFLIIQMGILFLMGGWEVR